MAKVIGYIWVNTTRQDADNQKHELLEYTNQKHLHVDEFIEIGISSRKGKEHRRIEALMSRPARRHSEFSWEKPFVPFTAVNAYMKRLSNSRTMTILLLMVVILLKAQMLRLEVVIMSPDIVPPKTEDEAIQEALNRILSNKYKRNVRVTSFLREELRNWHRCIVSRLYLQLDSCDETTVLVKQFSPDYFGATG